MNALQAIGRQIVKGIRCMGEWIYGAYAWLLSFLCLLVFGSLIVMAGTPAHARPIARTATRILFRLGAIPISAHGLEKLPQAPHLLLVNHTSFLDGLVLSALLPARPGYAFVARQQFSSQALLWPVLRRLGMIVLRHSSPLRKASNIVVLTVTLRRGESLIIFPEGGFIPEPGLRSFHTGAFVAAATENVPVVVAGLRGTRNVLRPRSWLPRRSPISLEIGTVLHPEGKDMQSILRLCQATHDAMAPLTGEEDVEEDGEEKDAGTWSGDGGSVGDRHAGDSNGNHRNTG
ncbi:hypothetical protein GCM10027343_38440 [Noviherbaspirillum agri]